jgi:hypothetical protein
MTCKSHVGLTALGYAAYQGHSEGTLSMCHSIAHSMHHVTEQGHA